MSNMPEILEIKPRVKPDWKLARDLYLQEVPLKLIAEQSGATVHAIRCRAWRNRWKAEPDQEIDDIDTQPRSLQEVAAEWVANMAISILASSKWWMSQELTPATYKEAKDLEQARQSHIASARSLFGLDKPEARSTAGWSASSAVIDVHAEPSAGSVAELPAIASADAPGNAETV